MQNDQISWQKPPDSLKLKINEIHVWKVDLNCNDQVIRDLHLLLSGDERHRADRFRFEKHRKRFIISRGVLRFLIGRHLGLDPGNVEFKVHPHGKPFLTEKVGNLQFQFNLSHSHTLALYGFTAGNEVGIDCEYMRSNVRFDSIARRFFCSSEIELVHKTQNREKIDLFYTVWTRKEAYLKATGKGLNTPLNHFDVMTKPGSIIQTEKSSDPQNSFHWKIHDIHVDDQYKAAVAVQSMKLMVFKYGFSFDYFLRFFSSFQKK